MQKNARVAALVKRNVPKALSQYLQLRRELYPNILTMSVQRLVREIVPPEPVPQEDYLPT